MTAESYVKLRKFLRAAFIGLGIVVIYGLALWDFFTPPESDATRVFLGATVFLAGMVGILGFVVLLYTILEWFFWDLPANLALRIWNWLREDER